MACARTLQCLRRVPWLASGCLALPCLWGLFLLLVTVLLWTATSLLMQRLFLTVFPRPFFSTLVQSACPAIFLLPSAAAALRSRSSRGKGLRDSFWKVAFAGFLVKDAQALTVDSCLRLLERERQLEAVASAFPEETEGSGWSLRGLLRRYSGGSSVELSSRNASGSSTAAAAGAQRQLSPEALEEGLPPVGCCSRCSTPEGDGDDSACSARSTSPGASPVSPLTSLGAAAFPVVSRRSCAADGLTGSNGSTECSSSCSSDGEGRKTAVERELEVLGASGRVEETEATDALALKELKVRMLSVKRSLPLTAIWLVAQVTYDSSLPLMTITSSSVIHSTSVFLCYLLAIAFLKQPLRHSVLSCLLVLAGGVALISSHVPTSRHAAIAAASLQSAAAAAAVPFADASPQQQQVLPAVPVVSSSSEKTAAFSSAGATVQQLSEAGGGGLAAPVAGDVTAAVAAHAEDLHALTETAAAPSVEAGQSVPAVSAAEAAAATPAAAAAAAAEEGGGPEATTDSLFGYILCFTSAVAYAVHTTALKAQKISDPALDVGLVYGLMGLWVLLALPVLTVLLHVLRVETFMWPNLLAWAVLLFCGFVGTALADVCWGQAVYLLNPVVASAASNVQIPISLLLDGLLVGRRFDGWYVMGMVAVVAAVVAVTLLTADSEQHRKQRRVYSSVRDTHNCGATRV